MTKVGAKDPLFGAQTLRALGSAPYGGADVGECLTTLARVQGTSLDSWYDEWTGTAERLLDRAARAEAAGRTETARGAWWRASTYLRTAGLMVMGPGPDPRLVASNQRQTEAFRRGAALLPRPPEVVRIPYERTTLPGYLFTVDDDPAPRPLVIALGGYDSTAEEGWFSNGAAALARGYHVLTFDGPGQGGALVRQGLVMRPDWDRVLTPVVDFVSARAEVDADRIAVIGASLGGFLAPRAASVEHRLAACVADCGSYDLFADALGRMPRPLARGFQAGRPGAVGLLRRILDPMARHPTAGWALRRGQLVHGAPEPVAYLSMLREYTLDGHAGRITCPTLVCQAETDEISASAPALFAALRAPAELVRFTVADGAGDHCEAGARTLFHDTAFGWLDPILRPATVRP